MDLAGIQIFGQPLFIMIAVTGMLFLFCSAAIAILNRKGIALKAAGWHPWLAMTGIALGIIHALMYFLG